MYTLKHKGFIMAQAQNWHQRHRQQSTVGQRIADGVAKAMGSWSFIFFQTTVVVIWIGLNLYAYAYRWDPYPFILLNLVFSTQASYAAPIIMMAQNRQADRDRAQAEADFMTTIKAEQKIEALQASLSRIEEEKLNEILHLLNKTKKKS
jgi:uncharacterized membrane protein